MRHWIKISLITLAILVGIAIIAELAFRLPAPTSFKEPQSSPTEPSRQYPEVIKGAIVFNTRRGLASEAERLKALGVNTILIYAGNTLKNGQYLPTHGEEATLRTIAEAKRLGFAVALVPEYWEPNAEKATTLSLEEHLDLAAQRAVEWAKRAEEHQVELFAPYNEFNGNIKEAFFGGYGGGSVSNPEIVQVTNQWHQQILERIKEVYRGRTIAKLDPLTADYDLTGYDYIGITLEHSNQTVEEFAARAAKEITSVAAVAQQSGARWLVSEAYLEYGSPLSRDPTANEAGQSLKELQDEYFSATFAAYRGAPQENAGGYVFAGWTIEFAGVKGRPAEKKLAEFFKSL